VIAARPGGPTTAGLSIESAPRAARMQGFARGSLVDYRRPPAPTQGGADGTSGVKDSCGFVCEKQEETRRRRPAPHGVLWYSDANGRGAPEGTPSAQVQYNLPKIGRASSPALDHDQEGSDPWHRGRGRAFLVAHRGAPQRSRAWGADAFVGGVAKKGVRWGHRRSLAQRDLHGQNKSGAARTVT